MTAPARDGVGDLRSGRKKACGAVEQKKASKQESDSQRLDSEWWVFVEQIELLARIVVRLGPEGLVVTADLGEVSCLELQGDLHEHLGDASGCFVGDGVVR